jgi:hypothetical protein
MISVKKVTVLMVIAAVFYCLTATPSSAENPVRMVHPYYGMPKYFAGGQDVWLEHCLQSPFVSRRPPMANHAPAYYCGSGGYVPPNGARYGHREPGFGEYAYIIVQDRALKFVDRSAHEGFRRLFRGIFNDGAEHHHQRRHGRHR